MNRTNLSKANCNQAKSVQPDPGKQASMPKPPQRNVDSTISNPDKKKLRPPDRKNIDVHLNRIKLKEKELKSCNRESESIRGEMKTLQPNRYVLNEEKKKNNLELKTLREEIFVKNNNLSRLESGLTYKNEHKINEAIKKLEVQLSCNNFKLREEKKIVAEIDSLKRSKKSLVNYLAQKKEIDELREQQLKKRRENEQYHRQVSMLISEEDEMKSRLSVLHTKIENLHLELNDLNEQKKVLLCDYKRREKDHNVMKDAIRKKNRQNTKHKEEEKQLFNREDLLVVCTPEEEYIQHCNTLIRYLQQFPVGEQGQATRQVSTPTEEKAAAASLGPVPEIQGEHGATYVLLKKNEECEDLFFGAGRRQNKKSKKGRKFSATKPLTHSPQVFAQFANLQMSAPAGFAEILPALKQLEEKKKYFERLSQQREEDLISPCRAQDEASAELDDVCLSDSGYSADGSAACELSRQVSHTESIDGNSSNINLLEIINLIQADSVHNNQSPPPPPPSSSSSSDEDDDDDDDDEDDDDDDDDIIQELGKNRRNSDASNSLHLLEPDQSAVPRLLPRHCATIDAATTRDGQVTATPLLCKIQPGILPAAKLGTTQLKVAPVITQNSCTEEMPGCEELLQKKNTDGTIVTNGDKRNSCSSNSSSSSNCNDDLSEKSSRNFRTLVNVAKSKRVRNFPPTTDISCDLKGIEYEALTSPSGLRFPSRTVPRPSASCESSSDDEEKNINAEGDDEECEEMEPPAAEEEEEEEEDKEEDEEEEEEGDEEIERRKDEDDITDNSYSEKDHEKSAPGGGSEDGENNTDDDSDSDKILEDEERGFIKDIL